MIYNLKLVEKVELVSILRSQLYKIIFAVLFNRNEVNTGWAVVWIGFFPAFCSLVSYQIEFDAFKLK